LARVHGDGRWRTRTGHRHGLINAATWERGIADLRATAGAGEVFNSTSFKGVATKQIQAGDSTG
jgi:hypothetical protein